MEVTLTPRERFQTLITLDIPTALPVSNPPLLDREGKDVPKGPHFSFFLKSPCLVLAQCPPLPFNLPPSFYYPVTSQSALQVLPPCPFPPSCALRGTFAPWPSLIHLATPLRPGELKALFVCTPWEILTPCLHAPTKQRKHLLTAKALTNSAFQMNPVPCGVEGGECPG